MNKVLILTLSFICIYTLGLTQNYRTLGKVYDAIENEYYGASPVLIVSKNEKYGLIDKQGTEILSPQYDYIYAFEGDYAIATLDKREYLLNTKGEVVYTNLDYEEMIIFDPAQALLRVEKNEKYGLMTLEGKFVFPIQYKRLWSVGEGFLMAAQEGELCALFDLQGRQLSDFLYKYAGSVSEGLLNVAIDDQRWGLITTEGKEIAPMEYNYIERFHEGLVSFTKGDKSGFLDKKGKVVIEGKYESVHGFYEGLAFARGEDHCIFINSEGKQALKDKFYFYEIPSVFVNGSAIVMKETNEYRLGLIDKKGKTLLDFKYSWIESQKNGYYVATSQDESFVEVVDTKGKVIATFSKNKVAHLWSVGSNQVPLFILQNETTGAQLIQLMP